MILALDLSTFTGWCMAEAGKPVSVGTFRLPKTGKNVGLYLRHFEEWLNETLEANPIDWVVFESPILPATTQIATVRKLYSLAGLTELICTKHAVQCAEVNIATVKKMLAGNGRAKKPEMIDAAKARGVNVLDDNQADAFGIFLCAVKARFEDQLDAYPIKGALL